MKLVVWSLLFLVACKSLDKAPETHETFTFSPELEVIFPELGDPSSEFAVVTHYTQNMTYVDLSIPNHIEYVNKNKYVYIRRKGNITDEFLDPHHAEKKPLRLYGWYWQKVAAIRDAMEQKKPGTDQPRFKWILWIDADAIFTNMRIKIEDVVRENPEVSLIIARDMDKNAHVINSGIILFKNDDQGREIMKKWISLYPVYKDAGAPEQQAIQDMIYQRELDGLAKKVDTYDASRILSYVSVRESGYMNSFVPLPKNDFLSISFPDVIWKPCDWIAHSAGELKQDRIAPILLQDLSGTGCL